MQISILDTSNPERWREAVQTFPEADAYFMPEYHEAYERNGDGRAQLFVSEVDGDRFAYPFIVKQIKEVAGVTLDEDWYDISSVYGYSGPLSTTTDPSFLDRTWAEFSEWCASTGVITEFVRFHPLLGNFVYASDDHDTRVNRQTIAVDLPAEKDQLWSGYPSVQRNMVRKARNAGLKFSERNDPDTFFEFRELYRETMIGLGASEYLYFSPEYFDYFAERLGHELRLFTVTEDGKMIAAGMFLHEGELLHYHLSASSLESRKVGGTNFLLHNAAEWGIDQGCTRFHLGGGTTSDPDDPLFKFKRSLSRETFPYHISTRVHHESAYGDIKATWERATGKKAPDDYMLFYRQR